MMTLTRIHEAIIAEADELPPIGEVMYQYVVAGNGLFIRAEDSRMRALVQVAPAQLHGLAELAPIAELKVDRVPGLYLKSVLASARRHLPDEVLFQFGYNGEKHNAVQRTWRCWKPEQHTSFVSIEFRDDGESTIDLHSHNTMPAFFSEQDNRDEQGLRFYAVIGRVDTEEPEIRVRVGVYGHFMHIPADSIFDDLGPFVDMYSVDSRQESDIRACRVCGCTDAHGCENGCFWVEDDLCDNCVGLDTRADLPARFIR